MSALPWVLYDQWDGVDFFATEAEALARAASLIEGYLVDEQWNEDVDGIVIARLTHVVGHEDMTPPEGREGEPWFHCVMVPAVTAAAEAEAEERGRDVLEREQEGRP